MPRPKGPTGARKNWLPMLMEFMGNLRIDSKETGVGALVPYGAQIRFLEEICTGLDAGVRMFVNLKARQLGVSTICLVIDLFWLFVHKGLQGALITDTEDNKEVFRAIIDRYIEGLPKGYKVGVKRHNRTLLQLNNGSMLQYMVAGSRGSTKLGTSRGLNFIHATEVAKWGDGVNMASLMATLAETHPDRLYIFESTANGFNQFYSMWLAAQEDVRTQRAFFIGWWAKEIYRIDRRDARFGDYMVDDVTAEEREKCQIVETNYGHHMTAEQIAWYRWRSATRSPGEGSMEQEFPWHEVEAFIETGKSFFPAKSLTVDLKRVMDGKSVLFKGYRYMLGEQFTQTELDVMQLDPVEYSAHAELRMWHPPKAHARYVIGADPAYGRTDWGDSHAISVWRCYADRLVQVAEYATPDQETYQVIWVLAHLAGIYRDCIINLEINGPGTTIMQGIKHLKAQLMAEVGQKGIPQLPKDMMDALTASRWYLYHRPDSMGAGYAYGWKCLALDTPLPTPSGWTTMGAVRKWDMLIDDAGNPCTVTGVSPVQINRECYRVTFDDGTQIVADADHLWSVHRHLQKCWSDGREKIRKTTELKVGRHVVKIAAPQNLFQKLLPIHPYVLGVWLGDGAADSGRFYAAAEDIEEIGDHLRACGAILGGIAEDRTCCRQRIEGLTGTLRREWLIGNKHIPDDYLRGSLEQRAALLQGLMDTHGSVRRNARQCSFTTSSVKLAGGFFELLRTLGFKAKFVKRNRTLRYGGGESICETAFQFFFAVPFEFPVFRLERKQAILDSMPVSGRRRWHRIVSVEKISSVPVRCVQVDSRSKLYLAGRGMIPTHNTTADNKLAIMNQLRDTYMLRNIVVNSGPLLQQMKTVRQDGIEIAAAGKQKDDRVFAAAFAHKAWIEWVRPSMVANMQTYALVTEREIAAATQPDMPNDTFVGGIIRKQFEDAAANRRKQALNERFNRRF